MRKILFLAVIGLTILCALTTQQSESIKKAEWLIGTWENSTPKGSIYETWHKVNTDEYGGRSYILRDNDTIVFETIRLVQEGDRLFYIPLVKNQNDNLPVRFALKAISSEELVFENKQHDFPQIISYTKINTDSMVAKISGIKSGHEQTQTFPMKRVK